MSLFTTEEIAAIGRCGEVFTGGPLGQGEYAQEELRAIERPHILDIGANIGAFAVWASRYWPGCRLVCYEPNASLTERRRDNLKRFYLWEDTNPERLVGEYVGAVSDHAGQTKFADVGRDLDGMTTTLHAVHSQVTLAPCIDAADCDPADIIKLDCEGAECFFLTRYKHFATVKAVLVEWHTIPNRVIAEYILDREGFTCLRGRGEEGLHEGFSISYGCQIWMRVVT